MTDSAYLMGGTKLCHPRTPMPITPAIQVDPRYEYLADQLSLQGHYLETLPLREPSRYSDWDYFPSRQHSRKRDLRRKLLKAAQLGREHQTRKAG